MKFLFCFKVFLAFVFIFGAAKAFTINCSYRTWILVVVGEVYVCETTNIPITLGNRVTNVTGQHWSNKTNDDVGFIVFYGNWTLSFVPQGISNFFPNIRAISIGQTTFEILYGDEFNEFPKLEWLDIWETNLIAISSRLFEKTPKMVYIRCHSTSLQQVGHDLFTPLNVTQLQWVSFISNPCISQWGETQAQIIQLISDLQIKCPFDDEEIVITTTTALTTTTTERLTCRVIPIEDLVCDLKDEMEEVQENLAALNERIDEIELNLPTVKEETKNDIENLQNELNQTRNELKNANEKIKEQQAELTNVKQELQEFVKVNDDLQSKVLWLEEEILRMSVKPCACK